uniref:Retrotransposon protein, putative, Ty1-copia subclass n=1 Tax=Tanacetum cinerariifolium TaxID=118510 RepID=A0A6L2J573_TANCI|nr:retrotransposon protein, putative, Ty1-copia subclass [Tanacetum cinerariifolium]
MLMTMDSKIQRNLEPLHAHEMLKKLKTLFAQQAEHELLQTTRDFHSCRQEEGQSVSSYVLKMKGYIDNLERLGHPVILGLGTVNELHAMLKLYEQTLTLPKSNAPALHVIRAGKVHKGNKHKKSQSQMAARGQNHGKGKNKQAYAPKPKISPPPKRENPAKDSICHEYREGLRASRKLKPRALCFYIGNGQREAVEAIDTFYLCLPSGLEIVLSNCHYAPSITRGFIYVSCLYEDGFVNRFVDNTIQVSRNKKVENQLSKTIKSLRSDRGGEYMSQEFLDHLKDHRIITHRTPPYTSQHNENSLINQEANGSLEDLEIIQEEDTQPSLNTSLNHEKDDLEIDEPQSDVVPIRRSTRTRHAPDRMCLYIDAEEHELGDLGEPTNYKAALLDLESEKWLNAMNVEMQSMKGNEVCVLVEPPPNGKTVGSYTQTPGIDYEETFSPVADIRSIRILIAIAAYYYYEIWQMDVKFAFLNGYLNEESVNTYLGKCFAMKDLGSIMYVVRCTRPNVAFAQNVTSRFQPNPCDIHWTTVKNILKYLRNTKDMFLVYRGNKKQELRVSYYTDARYLTNADELKSQTGYVFVLNGSVVDWKNAKQSIFATSSAEAEYIATFDAFKEAVWVRKFISWLGVVPTIEEPISMYCDNTRAIAIANESGIMKGARHFCAKVHYL